MKKLLFIAFILIQINVFSQTQFPASTDWKYIKTNNFKVIFPAEMEDFAKETALIMDSVYQYDTKALRVFPRKIDLVLYNKTSMANAYASIAPRKMQWYCVPPANPSLSLTPWNQTLGIHEYRHTIQYTKLNYGFTKVVSILFGQMGQAVMQNWSTPNWFFEGDAVYSETILSESGRGRMPAFSLPIRTIVLTRQKFSYENAYFNTYRTFYPNHYYLGYYMVTYINRNYGEDTWNKILNRTSMFSYWPYTFETSVRKYTGSNVRETYKKAMVQLDSMWTEQLKDVQLTEFQNVNKKRKRVYTNYFDPQIISKDTLLVLKSGLDMNLGMYYLMTDGTEKFIREIPDDNISYSKNLVVWTNYTVNPRYNEQSYNDIVIYELNTGKILQITNKQRYFSPELSKDGKKIVAVSFPDNLKPQIVIMDLDGNVTSSYEIPNANNVMMPVFTSDDKNIVYLKTDSDGESMEILNISTKEIKVLIPSQWIKFDRPYCVQNYVLFNYDYSGITNIYALDLNSKEIYQVNSSKYSSAQVAVDEENNILYFTNYDEKGTDLAKITFMPDLWTPISETKVLNAEYFNSPYTENTFNPLDDSYVSSQKNNLVVEDYKAFSNLFKIHSWTPLQSGDNNGFDIYSVNTLNDFQLVTTIMGNIRQKNLLGGVSLLYSKFYPVIGLTLQTGQNSLSFDKQALGELDSLESWYQNKASLSVTVPLDLSTDILVRSFDIGLSADYTDFHNFEGNFFDTLGIEHNQVLAFGSQMNFVNRKFKSYRDLFPKFGQSAAIGANYVPDVFGFKGLQTYAQLNLYFPGILKHHGIRLQLSYESKNGNGDGLYVFDNFVTLPRGYENYYFTDLYKLSLDYKFPICYPDINIPYLLYIKRIKGGFFYDYAQYHYNNSSANLSSYGFELSFDFNILRMNFIDLNLGLRFCFSPDFDNGNVILPIFMEE